MAVRKKFNSVKGAGANLALDGFKPKMWVEAALSGSF